MRRVIDTLLALVGIALLAPLILLISVCVLIASGRPILFRQWRAGQNGMPFQLVKFRSMRDTRDPSGQLLPAEERVTTIGRLLRRSRLDELPELWNILKGEMAFIGPRPLLPATVSAMGPGGAKQIGRAACGGRGCRSTSISVGAV